MAFLTFVMALMMAIPAMADWKKGDKIQVEWKGTWYAASVLDTKDGKYQIHYDGWGNEYDEWVVPARTRPSEGAGSPPPPPAAPAQTWEVGDNCDVNWKGQWYKSSIKKVKDGKYFVHYDGWDKKWDEWATPDRIRARQ